MLIANASSVTDICWDSVSAVYSATVCGDLLGVRRLTPALIEFSDILHLSASLWHIDPWTALCNAVDEAAMGKAGPVYPHKIKINLEDEFTEMKEKLHLLFVQQSPIIWGNFAKLGYKRGMEGLVCMLLRALIVKHSVLLANAHLYFCAIITLLIMGSKATRMRMPLRLVPVDTLGLALCVFVCARAQPSELWARMGFDHVHFALWDEQALMTLSPANGRWFVAQLSLHTLIVSQKKTHKTSAAALHTPKHPSICGAGSAARVDFWHGYSRYRLLPIEKVIAVWSNRNYSCSHHTLKLIFSLLLWGSNHLLRNLHEELCYSWAHWVGVEKTDWVEQFYHKIFPKSYSFFSSDSPRWRRTDINWY